MKGAFLRCFRQPRFWVFGIQYFLLVLIQSFYTTWLPTYLMRARGLSLKAMGMYASLPWVAVFLAVFVAGYLCDRILKKTGSIYWARTPVAMAGFVVSALALIGASRATNMPSVISLLCLSFAAVGFVQVVVWSATQDLGREFTGVMSGWTNVWGALSNVAGPVTVAYVVKLTGSWESGLIPDRRGGRMRCDALALPAPGTAPSGHSRPLNQRLQRPHPHVAGARPGRSNRPARLRAYRVRRVERPQFEARRGHAMRFAQSASAAI